MKLIKPIILILLLVLTSCGIFKTRVVNTNKKDSTSISNTSSTVNKQSSSVDTTKTKVITSTDSTDSTETTETIVPVQGQTITIDKNGNFSGQASNIIINKKSNKKSSNKTNTTEDKGISQNLKSDSSGNKQTTVKTSSKVKSVTATPDYKWIIYIVGILLILGFAGYCYYHFVVKKTI